MAHETAVRLEHISKSFGTVKANDDVNLEVRKGEILALLGENGSGKTTLMNMLSGIYYPDSGSIYVDDKLANITSPKDAYAYHIGMIHQHFKLIDVFTSIENIVLGIKPTVSSWTKTKYFFSNLFKAKDKKAPKPIDKASQKDARKIVANICQKYGFKVDPDKKVYDMSVSERQTLEIVKAVYRGADVLILDEPTAVLTPIETEELFAVMRNMKKDGKSIIIITHKLNEVMEISDRVAVLRKGKCIGSIDTKDATESKLTEMMVGEKIELNIKRDEPIHPMPRLVVKNLTCKNSEGREVLHSVSFTANCGEILGIASDLIDLPWPNEGDSRMHRHLIKESSGELTYNDPDNGNVVNLRDKTAAQIRDLGVRLAFVPRPPRYGVLSVRWILSIT